MKKYLVLLLSVLLLLALPACACAKPEAAVPQESSEQVQSTPEVVTYYITKRQIEHQTGDINLTEYIYDDNWNTVSVRTLLNGEFASGTEYTFSEDGTQITMVTSSAHYESTTTKLVRILNPEGQAIKMLAYNGDILTAATEYTYDAQGREVKRVSTAAESGAVNTVEYVYDGMGNMVSYCVNTGAYCSRQEYSYDDQDHCVAMEVWRNDALVSRAAYTWEGNTRYGSLYGVDGLLQQETIVVYDDHGNVVLEETYDVRGTLLSRIQYEYIGTDGSICGSIEP